MPEGDDYEEDHRRQENPGSVGIERDKNNQGSPNECKSHIRKKPKMKVEPLGPRHLAIQICRILASLCNGQLARISSGKYKVSGLQSRPKDSNRKLLYTTISSISSHANL